VLAISILWFIPTLERLFVSRRPTIVFADEPLTFIGYEISQEVAHPGDTIDLVLYYRANRWLDADYQVSVHILEHPSKRSLTQHTLQLGEWLYPTSAWIPGLAVRNHIQLTLPEDIVTPASYWISPRVWKPEGELANGEYENLTGLPVVESDLPLVTDDAVILFSLPVVAEAEPPEPAIPATHAFDGNFALVGYAIPETAAPGSELALQVWWQTGESVETYTDFTQFIHLISVENDQNFQVYDRQPFEGRFPTTDWPPNLTMSDDIRLPLPDDLIPGEYRLLTGLYDLGTGTRVPVRDAQGQPVLDNVIELGTVLIEEAGQEGE